MSEERLQEIKDSISLQYKVQEANDLNNFNIFTDEEQELVNEIERLNNIIDKATEYIKDKYAVILADDLFLDHDERIERKRLLEIIDILKGSNKE